MTLVLLVGVGQPARLALEDALPRLAALGAEVDVVLARDTRAVLAGLPIRTVRVLSASGRPAGTRRPRRGTPRWFSEVARNRAVRHLRRPLGPDGTAWLRMRRDPWVLEAAKSADVLVALDRLAIWPTWRLARRNPRAAAVYGLDEALRRVALAAACYR